MLLSIGLTSYNNFTETKFTVQALRMYQDLNDVEIVVIDNFGSEALKNSIQGCNDPNVRYVRLDEVRGPAFAKDQIFKEARGEWVMSIDSHVMLEQNAIAKLKAWIIAHPDCDDLIQGPLVYDNLRDKADAMNDEWRGHMWGTWRNATIAPNSEFEIFMQGCGLFACRKAAWLGFNPAFRGFGGEEGYIHAKYRQAGRKTLCLAFLGWWHHFRAEAPPYKLYLYDKIRNYCIGFEELGMDYVPILEHFGKDVVIAALKECQSFRGVIS